MLFQKTLQDLIKGIRSHRKDPSAFVSKAIADIKDELRSNDPFLKAEAVGSFYLCYFNNSKFLLYYNLSFLIYFLLVGPKANIFADGWL